MVRVLVVEDEANIREMIALNLRLAGMEAVEAESAEAALPLLERKPGCDAAILDVMLPGMNGFSLCDAPPCARKRTSTALRTVRWPGCSPTPIWAMLPAPRRPAWKF